MVVVLPHVVRIKERVPSFMLTSINGRRHLDQLENGSDIATICIHCGQKQCIRRCLTCNQHVCEICIRTLSTHSNHKITTFTSDSPPSAGIPTTSFCNSCGCQPLTVPYYHCQVCDDYDLCDSCERINDALTKKTGEMIHDPSHPMIKYRVHPSKDVTPTTTSTSSLSNGFFIH